MKNQDIEKALNELIPMIGVYKLANQTKLLNLISARRPEDAVKEIALSMGLPIKIEITYVSEANIGNIPAKIYIPSNLPHYGSPDMIDFPINIQISNTGIKTPLSLLAVLAHELAHIVLHSKRYKKKDDEYYTDLTAMLMGYAKIMKSGRKVVKSTITTTGTINVTTTTHTNTITYGYLSDESFNYAYKMIEVYLEKQKYLIMVLKQKAVNYKGKLSKADKQYALIKYYLTYLGNNPDIKINLEDAQKRVELHSPLYFDAYISTKEIGSELAERIIAYCDSEKTYTAKDVESINRYSKLLEGALKDLTIQVSFLKTSIKVLNRNVSLKHRLKRIFRGRIT